MQSLKAKKPTACLTVGFLVHKIVLWKTILEKICIFVRSIGVYKPVYESLYS